LVIAFVTWPLQANCGFGVAGGGAGGLGVFVALGLGLAVGLGVLVGGTGVGVGGGVSVGGGVGVAVYTIGVLVAGGVGVDVAVGSGVSVGMGVIVGVKVTVKVGLGVLVGVAVGSVRESRPPDPQASMPAIMIAATTNINTRFLIPFIIPPEFSPVSRHSFALRMRRLSAKSTNRSPHRVQRAKRGLLYHSSGE
jgi:hypothetical protein